MNNTFIITKDWLDSIKTEKGGYTADQVRALGYSLNGKWKAQCIGDKITTEARKRAEMALNSKDAKSYGSTLKTLQNQNVMAIVNPLSQDKIQLLNNLRDICGKVKQGKIVPGSDVYSIMAAMRIISSEDCNG